MGGKPRAITKPRRLKKKGCRGTGTEKGACRNSLEVHDKNRLAGGRKGVERGEQVGGKGQQGDLSTLATSEAKKKKHKMGGTIIGRVKEQQHQGNGVGEEEKRLKMESHQKARSPSIQVLQSHPICQKKGGSVQIIKGMAFHWKKGPGSKPESLLTQIYIRVSIRSRESLKGSSQNSTGGKKSQAPCPCQR